MPINLTLMAWFSPTFPVGAFAYSHGLEWAQECGAVTNKDELKAWLLCLIEEGSLKSDLTLMNAAFNGEEINELALALQPSSERLLEVTQQGNSFVKIFQTTWTHKDFTPPKGDCAYVYAVAIAAIAYKFKAKETMLAYGLAFITNLISASIRLGIIGQTEGQQLINTLIKPLKAAVKQALHSTLENLGTSCFYSDFVSTKHETQYTRIFRS